MGVLCGPVAGGAAAATGLADGGCLGLQTGCSHLTQAQDRLFGDPVKVVVSPSGTDAYAITTRDYYNPSVLPAVVHLHRAPGGGLTFADCASTGTDSGCAIAFTGESPILASRDASISGDGHDLYVAGAGNVSHFRLAADGSLRYAECLRNHDGQGDCEVMPNDVELAGGSLEDPEQIVVSPDDRHVLVADDAGVESFARGADGALSRDGCVGTMGPGCIVPPTVCPFDKTCVGAGGLYIVRQMAVSPDGRDIYVAANDAPFANAVVHLRREPDGALDYVDCVGRGVYGCHEVPPGVAFEAPASLAISADGHSVYVGTSGDESTGPVLNDAMVRFVRASDGSLVFSDCAGHSHNSACTAVPDDVPLRFSTSLLSLDSSLYLTANGSGVTTAFPTAADGTLSYAGCFGGTGDPGELCEQGPQLATDNGTLTSASPDGRFIYGPRSGGLAWMSRSAPALPAQVAPTATTQPAGQIDDTAVQMRARIAAGGATTTWHMDWGATTGYGNATPEQRAGSGRTSMLLGVDVTGLSPATTYHYRVVAANGHGSVTGPDVSFTTRADPIGDEAGGFVALFGMPRFSGPEGIATAADGSVWVGEQNPALIGGPHVDRVTFDGTTTRFALPDSLSRVQDVIAGPHGAIWGASPTEIFSLHGDGTVDQSYDVRGESPMTVTAIAQGAGDSIWFVGYEPDSIGRLDPDGQVTRWTLPGDTFPTDLVLGPDGDIWFTEYASDAIAAISPSGAIRRYPLPPDSGPRSITVGPDGNLWFTELLRDRVGRITVGGTITEYPTPTALSEPWGIALGPGGHLFFAESARRRIGELDPSNGQMTEHVMPVPGSVPLNIVAAPGAMWFTDGLVRVGRLTDGTRPPGPQPPPADPPPSGAGGGGDPGSPAIVGHAASAGTEGNVPVVVAAPVTPATTVTTKPRPRAPRLRLVLPAVLHGRDLRAEVDLPSVHGTWSMRVFTGSGHGRRLVARRPTGHATSQRTVIVVPVHARTNMTLVVEIVYRGPGRGVRSRSVTRTVRLVPPTGRERTG